MLYPRSLIDLVSLYNHPRNGPVMYTLWFDKLTTSGGATVHPERL
jgi:hypothetical protein